MSRKIMYSPIRKKSSAKVNVHENQEKSLNCFFICQNNLKTFIYTQKLSSPFAKVYVRKKDLNAHIRECLYR